MLLGIVVVCVSSTPVAAVAVAPVPGQDRTPGKGRFLDYSQNAFAGRGFSHVFSIGPLMKGVICIYI